VERGRHYSSRVGERCPSLDFFREFALPREETKGISFQRSKQSLGSEKSDCFDL